jgi:hypothetical protein
VYAVDYAHHYTGRFYSRRSDFSDELYIQKQLYKFIQTWARKSLVLKLGPFLHAALWRTKRLMSISSSHTHITHLYVKLPTAQWWRILLLQTSRTQTAHQKCTRWRALVTITIYWVERKVFAFSKRWRKHKLYCHLFKPFWCLSCHLKNYASNGNYIID